MNQPREERPVPTDGGQEAPPPPSAEQASPAKRSRVGGIWVSVIVALVLLVLLLIFILQNLDPANIQFFGMAGNVPVGVGLLLAAIAGGVLVALIGAARILQLRRDARRARKTVH